ncbi:LysR family transcriptional regulator [Azohydromonas lata]|uniref:LysR family transcriptional regulator n=1 Tax=Azohydromonas lata TaxID=45677 RepID=A0ABU5IMJ0_9BURK|nr:LysR family transcriptional regulator [Azohydromonas lata]MDZ5460102.1 LysR family transcriptional regulator [Azohydromonas lata]
MDLRHLKYFLAVAEELNIGRAATRLHISQPPLTRNIKALEEELGVELFVRTAKGVELTQAGEMFKEEASNIRMLVEGAIDRVQRAGEGKLGRLDVGIFGSAIYDIIPMLLQEFKRRLPGVNVVLHTMTKSEQVEALRQRRITVAFNRMMWPEPDIGRELVATERLFAVLPDEHPLAELQAVPLRALAAHPMVLFPNVGRPNFVDRVVELCKQLGVEPTIAQEVGDAVTGIALVARGFGVSLIPESAAGSVCVAGATFRPLADAPHAVVDLSVLYRATDPSPLLKSFLAVVREYRAARTVAPPQG